MFSVNASMLTKYFVYLICIGMASGQGMHIGGIMDGENKMVERAYKVATRIFGSSGWTRGGRGGGGKLRVHSAEIPSGDSLRAEQAACDLLQRGVVGMFGPWGKKENQHVAAICDMAEIPLLTIRSEPGQRREACQINLHPSPHVLAKVFVDLVTAYGWKTFTIMYENGESLVRVSELLKMHDAKGYTVTLRQLDLGLGDNFRPVLRRIKQSGDTNFVLDSSIEKLDTILKQAQQVGIMSDIHSYIITSLDMHTIDLEQYQHGGANITGLRLVYPFDDPLVQEVVEKWNQTIEEEEELTEENALTPRTLTVDVALTFDAVLLFAAGIRELNSNYKVVQDKSLDCDNSESWEHGFTLINFMKTSYVTGLTRNIKFDHEGFRTDFLLDILEVSLAGVNKVGSWNSTEGLNLTRVSGDVQIPAEDGSLVNRTFIILISLTDPYGMLKDSTTKLEGNDRFEGFGIELIEELAKMLGFNYTFVLQEDNVYGSLNRQTGEWNGMVKQLLDWKADLAITDLTITSDRQSAVDFTNPFMNLGISILYKKPTKQPPSLFSFMSPFSSEVWMYLGMAYLGVSMLLFILGRLSPEEWNNPYPCIEEPEFLENQFSFRNALWFTVGSVLQQGSEIAPIAVSTRMVASIWWFFTLIMVSSYTANLAAFLTVESNFNPISSAEDLANQNVIRYGAKRDGSTLSFFKDADYPTYQKMYAYMSTHPEDLTSSNAEGVQRIKDENYAYIMESTSIEYTTERECEVQQVGGLLDDKGYGIAMRKNSPYRNTLSTAVLKLQEEGKLLTMKIKWWKEKRGGGACSGGGDEGGGGALALTLANVGGVYIVLVGGCVTAFFAAAAEMLIGVWTTAKKAKVPFRQEVVEELKFLMQCGGDTKPVRHRSVSEERSRETKSPESRRSSRSICSSHASRTSQASKFRRRRHVANT